MKAPSKLILLIVGESLFNDGMVSVLFNTTQGLASGREQLLVGTVMRDLFISVTLAILVGYLVGMYVVRIKNMFIYSVGARNS